MNFKKIFGKIHLWLGLSSGLLVFIIAITGCLYAFKDEILDRTETYKYIQEQNKAFLMPSEMEAIARKELPGKLLHAIKYNSRNEAAEAIFYHYEPTYYYTIYINPYDGQVLRINDNETGFFHFILDGHFYLWLPPAIGQPVVASATLVFIVLLISGLIMWYPKNRAAAKQRYAFQWKATTKWKRKNYDLHNVLGFYASTLALVFALTGLVWGFQWFANSYYTALGGEKSLLYMDPVSKTQTSTRTVTPLAGIDKVWLKMKAEYPTAAYIEVHPPETDSSSIAANANLDKGTYWKTDYRYFDQYTLKELPVSHVFGRLKDATIADKVMRMNYDIHVGAIGGLAGKILAFCISLLIASLPVTGFMIWYGKRNKVKNRDFKREVVLEES
ncbi:PepSY-associated TM helix domain-containing protein [Arundinibacter roseus]|uniref:PepSY domain-containing protein n=1 Tax=Arundinibacter roseus TaxID=2070510 RepID=A0A4R4KKD5_9BACT|nr:PepSY-associated TM helix domain-containing protein [Arundinibacter roseus]TDB67402.1 PepSY domain-containing protein [Arundinibacter roseus]